jgi:hypothetical protein
MNFNRIGLVAVAVMMGSLSALGCKSAASLVDGDASDETQPADPEAPGGVVDNDDTQVNIPAPPPVKVEVEGVAPSAHSVWSPGYWRWDTGTTSYAWVGGFWQDRLVVAPYAPPPLRVEYVTYRPVGDYFWAPGYWRWTGASYYWMPGYWAGRRVGFGWVRPYWVSYGGSWECHGWGWEQRTAGWGRDADDWSRRGWSEHDREGWDRRYHDGRGQDVRASVDRREHREHERAVSDQRSNPGASRAHDGPRSTPAPRNAHASHTPSKTRHG